MHCYSTWHCYVFQCNAYIALTRTLDALRSKTALMQVANNEGVWSEPSLPAYKTNRYWRIHRRTQKATNRLCRCAAWSAPSLPDHGLRAHSPRWTYSRILVTWTSLGPWRFVRGIDSSSHWGLIMTPGQEANCDSLGKSFRPSTQ